MAFTQDTKIIFKSGLQTALNGLGTYVPGTFYLTEDTNRLYVGNKDSQLTLLNSIVEFVDNIEVLNTKAQAWNTDALKKAHENDLYYIKDSNILAVWAFKDGQYNWVQINPDTNTEISTFETVISALTNGAQIGNIITDSKDTVFQENSKFAIVGDGKSAVVTANATDKTVSIKGDTYSLAIDATEVGDEQAVKFTLNSALGQDPSSVQILAGENVSIANDNGNIKIASDNWVPSESSAITINDGTISVNLVGNDDSVTTIQNASKIGYNIGVDSKTYVNLGNDLPIYTAAEIDKLFRELNGMTYRGTISAQNSGVETTFYMDDAGVVLYENSNASLRAGDMFLVQGNGIDIANVTANKGDIIIAGGTENTSDGYIIGTPTWAVVPSGDDTHIDTVYSFTANKDEHSLTVDQYGSNEGSVGKITLVGGDDIVLSSTVSEDNHQLVTTIEHAQINADIKAASAGTVTENNGVHQLTVLENITIDNGHVTSVTPKTYTLPQTTLDKYKLDNLSSSENGAKVKITSYVKINEDVLSESFNLASQTLSMFTNETDNIINIELTWGSF